MKRHLPKILTAALIAASAWAQQPQAPGPEQAPPSVEQQQSGAWRRAGDTPSFNGGIPSQITIPAGTWIKIRVDQPISSDHNMAGDHFSGTLAQSLIADGIVIARIGQTIEGRVTEAVKAGRTKGTSRLGIELTEVGIVDGQQLPLHTQLIQFNGGTSNGRDAAAIAVTAGTGAAIGGAAAGGFGAGIGALAGAVAGGIGVVSTRGRATEIFPETVMTFRTLAPVTVSTDRSAQAFQPVRQTDYQRQTLERRPVQQPAPSVYYGGYYPYPNVYGGYWGPGAYGGYWGPGYYGVGVRVYGGYGGYYGGHGGHR